MITFLFCLFIFLSGFSFLSLSLPLTLFNLSFYPFHFPPLSYSSLRPFTISIPFCLFSFWPRTDIESITSDGRQSSLLSSWAVWCRRAEPHAFLSQLLTPKNMSLVDSWPAVDCWVDTGRMQSGNRGIVRQFSSQAGQMSVMLLSQAVLSFYLFLGITA